MSPRHSDGKPSAPTLLTALLSILLITVLAAATAPDGTPAGAAAAGSVQHASHSSVPDGNDQSFAWHTPGWIAATDHYVTGAHHPGSADIAAPHYTPVRAARSGRVVATGWNDVSGWFVRVEHRGLGAYNYHTSYGHLVEEPRVRRGQLVTSTLRGGTVLGYVGRTGNADFSGPHVHFTIRRIHKETGRSEILRIPDLTIGDWVRGGSFKRGRYEGLTPQVLETAGRFDVRVTDRDGTGMYASTRRRGSELLHAIPAGTVLTVVGSERGQYRVRYGGRTGWIAHSGTQPAASPAFGVRISPRYTRVNVRRSPGGPVIGVVPGGARVTAFGTNQAGTWYRVQWRCTSTTNRSTVTADRGREVGGCPGLRRGQSTKYGWVSGNVSYPTSYFPTRTRVHGLTVHGDRVVSGRSRPDTSVRLGTLPIRSMVTVTGTRNGWYRIDYGGQRGWIRGWFTAGRQ
ncbi:peptidoglycan DD-metalloendopeptidase family protein [Haloechinothrix sp. LS1_15]|uniref:peptidoglycan DD-metalloendopeptidase family protein n=1 Tax=Haloechinothrix sp. LS1_15 TaxID=2652248 RepID=UPI00294ADDF7|nr:peptidoglycan DD-metalloendopeptidase family protein [Haloechinothrix sp. LS1_15]